MLDFLLRVGPFGDAFGAEPDGLDAGRARAQPARGGPRPAPAAHPRGAAHRRPGKIELAPEPIVADLPRLAAAMERRQNGGMVLIGRRQLRSNNSWMHNLPALVKGKDRCTMLVHPDDADAARPGRRRRGAA